MTKKKRLNRTPEAKAALLRRHHIDKIPVSTVCEEAGVQPSVFYQWQRDLFTRAPQLLAMPGRRPTSREAVLERKLAALEAKLANKDHVIAEITEEFVQRAKKRTWGALTGRWVPHDTRDAVVDFVRGLASRTGLPRELIVRWLAMGRAKFFDWQNRYGKANEHNAWIPRDHWIDEDERRAILDFHAKHPLEGYRRLAFMMIDRDVVYVSPSTVYRVLSKAGLMSRWNRRPSKKGTGFVQPLAAHEHWHIDISYLNIAGTFFYVCAVLDGASRAIVHWEIREAMKESDVELVVQRALEKAPLGVKPRVISDNGPQFIARDFKEFVRLSGLTHVRTAPFYPQSNGKIERWHKTLKTDALRPAAPRSHEEAERVVTEFVNHYNTVRLHSALGYVTPADFLAGRQREILAERDRKLELARGQRAVRRRAKLGAVRRRRGQGGRRVRQCHEGALSRRSCETQLLTISLDRSRPWRLRNGCTERSPRLRPPRAPPAAEPCKQPRRGCTAGCPAYASWRPEASAPKSS